MKHKILFFLIVFSLFFAKNANSQGVGVVLSGGGTSGLAHIGVLQALEEAEIPISYITGTSAGALIGALYSVGYSPEEIKLYVLSSQFQKITSGISSKEEQFFLREEENTASMINFNFSFDSIFKTLPTNFVSPAHLDFETLRLIGIPGAQANKDFDSLFIPFRCVAADIHNKESVTFKEGDLNAAVRASMTYPFYVNPIRVNGSLFFDGGLYNNFPANVMYDEFDVDYIIGSNVSSNIIAPSEDDVISQITAMLMQETDFELPCEAGIVIEPKMGIGTFEFSKAIEAMQLGYEATIAQIDSIRQHVFEKLPQEDLNKRRSDYNERAVPLKINELSFHSYNTKDVSFIKSNFMRDSINSPMSIEDFKRRYYRVYSTPQIKHIFPSISKNSDSTYHLHLDVTKQKPFILNVGGHFSSRSVNTGYIGLTYLDLGKAAASIHAETYFGKFYGSTSVKANLDLPAVLPIRITPYFTLNRWDYYRSSSTFFEDAKPSFLLQNEQYFGLEIAVPPSNNSKIALDVKSFENKDQYYQTINYSESDTADITQFNGETARLYYEYNTLNRKQWASEGTKLVASVRYIQGKEKSVSGNTIEAEYDLRRQHRWINLSLEGQRYYKMTSFFKIGLYGKAVFNSQSLFSNYTASVLSTTEFTPLPDSRTFYLAEYRAPQYVGGGLSLIFNYTRFFEFRIDPYFFQPFKQIVRKDNDEFGYSELLPDGVPMAGASIIFHSPIGPLRLSTNYFPKQDKPFVTQLSFGYVLFNNRSFR